MSTSRRSTRWWTVLLALAVVAAACTTGGTTDSTTDGSEAPATTTEEGEAPATTGGGEGEGSGDVFVHAADDEATTLDPAQVEPGEGGETIITQVYERLIEVGPDGPDLVPGIASEVPSIDNGLISEDGLTFTFPIREGIVFHDGTDLTAEDVKYSWDRAMTMDLPDGNAGLAR